MNRHLSTFEKSIAGVFFFLILIFALSVLSLSLTTMTANEALAFLHEQGYTIWETPAGTFFVNHLFPNVDSTYDIGASGNEFAEGHFDNVVVGGGNVTRSATTIVAASDASAIWRAQADIICNGTNDQTQITATVNNGGSVELSDGTFTISTNNSPISISSSTNFTLTGQGADTIIDLATGVSSNLIEVSNSSGITISNLSLNGDTSAAWGSDYTKQNGIYFNNVDGSLVTNIWSGGHKTGGITLAYGSDFNRVESNFTELNKYGVLLFTSCRNNIITGNTHDNDDADAILLYQSDNNSITNNLAQGIDADGFTLNSSDYNTLSGNSALGCDHSGIAIHTGSDRNLIVSNNCLYNGRHGIQVLSSDYNSVKSNLVIGNSQAVTNTYDNIIMTTADNTSVNNNSSQAGTRTNKPQYGINMASGTHNRITDNDIYDDGYGTATLIDSGTTSIIWNNRGYVTENWGSDTIASGQTTKVVAHGLALTPTVININFTEQATSDYGRWWTSSANATAFTLNVSADPGVSDLDFWWEAKVR